MTIEQMPRKPFHLAAYFNYCGFLQDQLESTAVIDFLCAMDRTALELAAWGGADDAVKLLLDHGANIDHTPPFAFFDGTTPLLHTCFSDQFKPLRSYDYHTGHLLLERGAKVQSRETDLNPCHTLFDWWKETNEETTFLEALLDHAEDVDKLLMTISPYNGMNSLHVSARNNLPKTTESYLKRHSNNKTYLATV